MINYLLIIYFYLLLNYLKIKAHDEICIENQYEIESINHLKLCYINDIENHSIFIWFTIEKPLHNTFDFYRFILRSNKNILLTNFTELIDLNNSLRIFHYNFNQYEICIEFQSISLLLIYQPRDGCILISNNRFLKKSLQQDSRSLLITLGSGIIIFFILGLIFQKIKEKKKKKLQNNNNNNHELPSQSSSILSTIYLRQQRDRFIRNFFHRYIDQSPSSSLRQWIHNRAFRYRISTQDQSKSRSGTFSLNINPLSSRNLSTNNIFTISKNDHHSIPSRKVSFHLSPTEEYEMI